MRSLILSPALSGVFGSGSMSTIDRLDCGPASGAGAKRLSERGFTSSASTVDGATKAIIAGKIQRRAWRCSAVCSVPERIDPARDTVERQRKHARTQRMQDHLRRARVLPGPRRLRIPPDHATEVLEDSREPRDPRLVVRVFDAASRLRELVRAHRRVADEDHFPVGTVGAQERQHVEALASPAEVVAPHVIVDAVVEIEVLEMLELRFRRGEELLADLHVRIHRPADVEKQDYLDPVAPLGLEPHVEPARVLRGAVDRAVEIELLGNALARKAPQAPKRYLEVASVEFDIAIEIAKG